MKKSAKILFTLIALALVTTFSAQAAQKRTAATSLATTTSFPEIFSSYPTGICLADGLNFSPWASVFNGYGCNKIEKSKVGTTWLHESPQASTSSGETHAALVTGPTFSGPLTFTTVLETVKQLRTGSIPNSWEVGWVLWNYSDNQHFYYFIAKPNGWELGKEDPSYPGSQRFLATGSSPAFAVGKWYTIKVVQNSTNTISVSVNGIPLTTFTDTENPYMNGKIGLYSEDAHVHFKTASVSQP